MEIIGFREADNELNLPVLSVKDGDRERLFLFFDTYEEQGVEYWILLKLEEDETEGIENPFQDDEGSIEIIIFRTETGENGKTAILNVLEEEEYDRISQNWLSTRPEGEAPPTE